MIQSLLYLEAPILQMGKLRLREAQNLDQVAERDQKPCDPNSGHYPHGLVRLLPTVRMNGGCDVTKAFLSGHLLRGRAACCIAEVRACILCPLSL